MPFPSLGGAMSTRAFVAAAVAAFTSACASGGSVASGGGGAGGEGAEAERTGAADRRKLQRFRGRDAVVSPRPSALHEDRNSRLVEQVHAVVARHRVGAEADPQRGLEQLRQWRDAVAQFRVRGRTMRDRTVVPRQERDVRLGNAHAMNQQRSRAQHARAAAHERM